MMYSEKRLRADASQIAAGSECAQRQDSLEEQLADLQVLANRFGMYDAADFLSCEVKEDMTIDALYTIALEREALDRRSGVPETAIEWTTRRWLDDLTTYGVIESRVALAVKERVLYLTKAAREFRHE